MPAPSIGIAGTGVVARALGIALSRAGLTVAAVAGRDPDRVRAATAFIGSETRAVTLSELPLHASYVLIATADDRIAPVAQQLAAAGFRTGLALHTCGALGPQVLSALQAAGVGCGVFHPLQTVVASESPIAFEGVAFGIAGDAEAVTWGDAIASAIGGVPIHPDPERMGVYHAAAVLASNGMAALMDASLSLMGQAGLDRDEARRALAPLSRTALENIWRLGPAAAVTGPVIRGDLPTVAAHLAVLAGASHPIHDLYRAVSQQLLNLAERRGLSKEKRGAIADELSRHQRNTEGHIAGKGSSA